jgi:hypothetical protein
MVKREKRVILVHVDPKEHPVKKVTRVIPVHKVTEEQLVPPVKRGRTELQQLTDGVVRPFM